MKISEIKGEFLDASGTASALSRQLSFAGIAIIWVIRIGENSGGLVFSENLLLPLYVFVIALSLDFLQHLYKSIAWYFLNMYHWNIHKNDETEVNVPGIINLPTKYALSGQTSCCNAQLHSSFFVHSQAIDRVTR